MGSVFAGRMILEVFLHSLKKRGGWGRRSPPICKYTCGVEKVHMASAFANPGVGGKAAPFANRLPARWYLNNPITIMRAKQVLLMMQCS